MIDGTTFGSVTVDGKTYDHDIWIFADNTIKPRTKSHEFEKGELELLAMAGPEVIIVGTGQSGCVTVFEGAKQYAKEKGITLLTAETPEAITKFNEITAKKAAAIHVTC